MYSSIGRVLVCGTNGYRFKSYYVPKITTLSLVFKKKLRILKKTIKKSKNNFYVLKNIPLLLKNNILIKFNKNLFFCKNTFLKINLDLGSKKTETLAIIISQKSSNLKINIFRNRNLAFFSIGSILKYFRLDQGKYIRRTLKGTKILLNFIKSIYIKKYFLQNNSTLLNIIGFNYNIYYLKSKIISLLPSSKTKFSIILLNLKLSFTKNKLKKIKSIKKRLRKKMVLDFLKKQK